MKAQSANPTLQDVAAKADVSTATVSRCLNFPDQVAEKTRNQVMEAVRALGYRPNFGARAMATGRTNTIGAIIPTMENAVFARGIQAFQDELEPLGYTLLVASTSYQTELEHKQIQSLVARGADGLLLIGHERNAEIYDFLDAQNVPYLVTWAYDTARKTPSVGFDNRAAMRHLTRQVIEMGHKNIAIISADAASNDRAAMRLTGVIDAMQEAKLPFESIPTVVTPYGIEQGAAAFEGLMQRTPRPTAILCGNDVLAVGALRRARELGIDVPQDVSITGFDDIELSQITHPTLTTVHVPHHEMGRRAARMLVGMVQDGKPPASVQLDTRTVMRVSLAPPK